MAAIITPSEVPKYVPGAVTAASDGLGWNGVWLRGYRYTGLDVLVPPVRDFTIVSYCRGSTSMERRYEGVWTKTHCGPGDVSLLTRSQQSHWHWTDSIEVHHVDLVHKGLPTKYAEVAQPDFEKLAVGFGAKGFRVNRPDDFGEIDKALSVEDGPVIVNVRINGDVELPVSWEIAQHLENTGE